MNASKLFYRPYLLLLVFAISMFAFYRIGYERGLDDGGPALEADLRGSRPSETDSIRSLESMAIGSGGRGAEGASAVSLTAAHGWQAGYELAAVDLESAIRLADGLPYHQRLGFVTGVFSFVSENRMPDEALTFANRQESGIRDIGLKTLVAKWTLSGGGIENESAHWEHVLGQGNAGFGLEVNLTSLLSGRDYRSVDRARVERGIFDASGANGDRGSLCGIESGKQSGLQSRNG